MRHLITVTKEYIQLHTIDHNNLILIRWNMDDDIKPLQYLLDNTFGKGWKKFTEAGIEKIKKVVEITYIAIENRYTPNYDAIHSYIYLKVDGVMYEIPITKDDLEDIFDRKRLPKEFRNVEFYMPFYKKEA